MRLMDDKFLPCKGIDQQSAPALHIIGMKLQATCIMHDKKCHLEGCQAGRAPYSRSKARDSHEYPD